MKISIITTYYNSVQLGDFVHLSMNCLLNQTYQNIEFVCVNDGSKDETLQQLEAYAKNDSRIIIVDKKNEGVAQYAKAAGQDIATGDYVMLFDHDDLLSMDAIEKAVDVLENNVELDAVTMLVKTQYLDGKVKYFSNLDILMKDDSEYKPRIMTGIDIFSKTVGKYDVHFRGLIRKDKFKSNSFRYKEKLVNGDEIVERFIFKNLVKIGSCQGIYHHYIYDNSSAKSYNLKKTDIARTDVILRDLFKKENVYEARKTIFEVDAYKTFVNAVKVYNHFKNDLSPKEIKFYKNRLKESYENLDKSIIINEFKGLNKIYHFLILNSFTTIFYFYKFKG